MWNDWYIRNAQDMKTSLSVVVVVAAVVGGGGKPT